MFADFFEKNFYHEFLQVSTNREPMLVDVLDLALCLNHLLAEHDAHVEQEHLAKCYLIIIS